MNLFAIHELKTDPKSFDSIDTGSRGTTTRFNDRGYRVNDYVVLRRTKYTGDEMKKDSEHGFGGVVAAEMGNIEQVPFPEVVSKPLEYTGKALMCKITHVQTSPGLLPGWAVLSLDIMDRFPNAEGFRYLRNVPAAQGQITTGTGT